MVLFMHVNTYMFFPMIDEKDQYELNGMRKDDINSLVEFIDQILLGHRDSTPEDEDDDHVHYYHVRSVNYYIAQCEVHPPIIRAPFEPVQDAVEYGIPVVPQLPDMTYDISGPPPKA